jgi:hypothetical protein
MSVPLLGRVRKLKNVPVLKGNGRLGRMGQIKEWFIHEWLLQGFWCVSQRQERQGGSRNRNWLLVHWTVMKPVSRVVGKPTHLADK